LNSTAFEVASIIGLSPVSGTGSSCTSDWPRTSRASRSS
jgi:hypothetical protein